MTARPRIDSDEPRSTCRMQALVLGEVRKLSLARVPAAVAGPGQALLQVTAVGICGLDVAAYLGRSRRRHPPIVLGHEVIGRVLELPVGTWLVAEGDRVVVDPFSPCGKCAPCQTGCTNLCDHWSMLGMDGQPGGFAELLAVRPEQIRPLGLNTRDRSAVLAEPLASALRLYRRVEAVQSRGTRLVLFGAGLEGSLLLQLMRNAGGWQAAVVEPSPDRRQVALEWGASLALDPAAGSTARAIREWAGGGLADIGVDACGSSDCRRAMVDCIRPDGVAVLFGLRDVRTEFDVASLIMHEKRLVTSFGYTGTDFRDAVRLLDKGAVDLGAHSEVWSMSEADIAMERASGTPGPILKHVLAWPTP